MSSPVSNMATSFKEGLAINLDQPVQKRLSFDDDPCTPYKSAIIPMMSLDDSTDSMPENLDESFGSIDSGYMSDSSSCSDVASLSSSDRRSSKKRKSPWEDSDSDLLATPPKKMCHGEHSTSKAKYPLRKHKSDSDLIIKKAMDRCKESCLIGDFSSEHQLPTIQGKHSDLSSISPETMADLVEGKYPNLEFTVVDCRYPYEYDGGHIDGAQNLFTTDMIGDYFLAGKGSVSSSNGPTKQIIIFHCEFSSKRGPKMLRFLRQQDRTLNKDTYPALHIPEIYVLEGGYKGFWEHCNQTGQTEHCVPQGYRLMLDEKHTEELKFFRKKSKSFSSGQCGGGRSRKFLSRLF